RGLLAILEDLATRRRTGRICHADETVLGVASRQLDGARAEKHTAALRRTDVLDAGERAHLAEHSPPEFYADALAARGTRRTWGALEVSRTRIPRRHGAVDDVEAGVRVDRVAGLRRPGHGLDASGGLGGIARHRRLRERHDELLHHRLAAVQHVE